MFEIRALYIGDVRFSGCNVFKLNEENKKFEMIVDNEYAYPVNDIMLDDDWRIFKVEYVGDIEEGEYEDWVNDLSIHDKDLENNGGRIPDGVVTEIDRFMLREYLRSV